MTPGATEADGLLRARCEGAIGDRYGSAPKAVVWKRLDDELEMIRGLGYASYFLTVGDVTDLIREMGVRCAARGSGAGSLVNYLLGVSGVDPVRHRLLMERFLSPLREALPDIDVDVESARRLEVYERILDRYGGERCVCVSMMDTYRVRHAVRDVGAALGMPPGETDTIAKAFPHIRARDARIALRELPELRASGLDDTRLDLMFQLVERLDGLPRHVAVHPCGVLLSDATLLDRTPVEASFAGFPMSQFDKDDVEDLGLLKLDVLGIRMQSSMAHAVAEIRRTDGLEIDLDDETQVPLDDPATYEMISSAKTLGVFQIESPGQRELVGKSGLDSFEDIITDISLFRPGPVKSDMVTPYLEGKQGWKMPTYLHDDLRPILGGTQGVVVFHEQVIEMIAQFAGISFAEADEKRRALGDVEGMAETKVWFFPRALGRGYPLPVVEKIWKVLEAFASFGFCKAHAAAFALPTFQSAWLKAHWPAHFLSGVLTHDPGMYPKRLILDDARQLGLAILGLDVNASEASYVVERVGPDADGAMRDGIRLALAEVKGINDGEVERIVAARPFHSLTDFWHRARVSRPVVERLVLAGGFDAVYGIDLVEGVHRRSRVTRRDLLLQVAELDRHARAIERAGRGRGLAGRSVRSGGSRPGSRARAVADDAAARNSTDPRVRDSVAELERHPLGQAGVWARAAAQSKATAAPPPVDSVQLTLELGDAPAEGEVSGLPEMTRRGADEGRARDPRPRRQPARRRLLRRSSSTSSGWSAAATCSTRRSKSELLVAGVKVATQTPPIRSGRRVIFLTLDDSTGPVDATFFEDAQGPYAATVFHSWLLVVRGELRRTGYKGVSLRATGCWELPVLAALWQRSGIEAVREQLAVVPEGFGAVGRGGRRAGRRRVAVHPAGDGPPAVLRRGRRRRQWPLHRRRHGPAPGAGALQRLRDVPLLRHQAGRRGHQGRRPQALAPQPRERRDEPRPRVGAMPGLPASDATAPAPPWCGTALGARARPARASTSSTSAAAPAASRSGWPSSATGSPWSTPAPTPWPPWPAGPARSASRSPASRATSAPCSSWPVPPAPTWCSATACSRWSTTRPPHWPRSARCSAPAAPSRSWSPSGTPRSSPAPWPATSPGARAPRRRTRQQPGRTGHRFTADEVTALLADAGFEVGSVHGVRVFADLVPGSLLDLEPGATAALVELERAVAERAEYLPLAAQLHVSPRADTLRSGCVPAPECHGVDAAHVALA